jgi:phosphoribosylaminoimidazolecarboxamide formyltransferase / IMP cyclohydrolase
VTAEVEPAAHLPGIAVLVSGRGSNLAALIEAQRRGSLGGCITLVLADRPCPAVGMAREAGIQALVCDPAAFADRAAWDAAIASAIRDAGAQLVVLAGFMRVLGPGVLDAFPNRVLNVHPALLPAFPGRDAIGDALAAGVRVTGVTVHFVTEALDAGPILLQEAVAVRDGEERAAVEERIHAVEHRLLPRAVALTLGGAVTVADGRAWIETARAAALPRPRRALLSVSDKSGLVELAKALVALGFELVSTGRTARALRDAGLSTTDVSAVTGSPEMLDGRVKTLHPRIHAGLLADVRNPDHREQLAAELIDPFEIVVSNLYPFAEAAARPDLPIDELIEEIDIGGPTLLRAAAKNHASIAVLSDPGQYDAAVAELRASGALSDATRSKLAVEAFASISDYDAQIASVLAQRLETGSDDPLPVRLDLRLGRSLSLRYGENPHQAAALYARADPVDGTGPFVHGAQPLQGKELSYNNILDAAAAASIVRDLRGAAVVIVKHGNPCGAAEAATLPEAWERALSGDPVSAFGGVVAVRGCVDADLATALTGLFLEVVVAEAFDAEALAVLAAKPNLRLIADPGILAAPPVSLEVRSAGGGVLVTQADVRPDDPATWRTVTRRAPTERELADLDLAWRIARRVSSNAITLVRDGTLVGVGAGQMSRVDSARLAVEKAGSERVHGAVCASDAFFPFPDGLEVCAAAGVTAFVEPGGSQRDAEVIAAADAAGAAMLVTGVRHFRH